MDPSNGPYAALTSSSTKHRLAELSALRQQLQESGKACSLAKGSLTSLIDHLELPQTSGPAFVEALLHTYPYYHDRASRQAVQECLHLLLSKPHYRDTASLFIKAYGRECSKAGIAASNAFVLIEWGSVILQHCALQHEAWNAYGLDVLLQDTNILDVCLSSDARASVKNSALVVTRRALRQVLRDNQIGDSAMATIVPKLTGKSQTLGTKSAIILGILAGVCARLPGRRDTVVAVKDLYYSFYTREILGSRTPIAEHIVAAFNDFFTNFTTAEDLHQVLLPALEKAMLRAPEVVLNDLISSMIRSLSSEIDLSKALADHLLRPLLTNIKSQNPMIRNGAMSTYAACISSSHDDERLNTVVSEILGPLASSKLPSSEQRILHARMLSLVSFQLDRSTRICTGLATIVIKEPNESAIAAEASALVVHISSVLATNTDTGYKTIPAIVLEAFQKGLGDKRPITRKIWTMRTGNLLWTLKTQAVDSKPALQFVDAVTPKLLDVFDDTVSNPQLSAQSGLATAAYVVVATHAYITASFQGENIKKLVWKSKILDRAFSSSQKGCLLNHRIYTKQNMPEEVVWTIRALAVFGKESLKVEFLPSSGDLWAQAFLYFVTAADVGPTERREAATALHELYNLQPEPIAELIICGLWTWYTHIEHLDKDTAAAVSKTGTSKLHISVRSILPPTKDLAKNVEPTILRNQLIKMLVLAQPEILPRVEWIQLCLQAGQDPGEIARSRSSDCLSQISQRLLPETSEHHKVNLAAYKAAADLAFVAPDAFTPILIHEIKSRLNASAIRRYGPTEVAIARTPEGTAFIDVLSTKGPKVVDKNARDYDTIIWEEEVRAQLAQKKGQEKRLTADEKIKVNAQLVKEAKIRQEVLELTQSLKQGTGLIQALATGPPTEPEVWMRPCLKALLDVITAGAGLLVGNDANEAYLACSTFVSSRLGSLRLFIGVATLRGVQASFLSDAITQEPSGGRGDIYSLP